MISLRRFTDADIPLLRQTLFPSSAESEIKCVLSEWETKIYDGKYFEMFAVCAEGRVVGCISLYQHNGYIVSAGPEIFVPYRQKGYAKAAMQVAYSHAAELGYLIAVAQVRTDNVASIRLHESLGFLRDCEMTNRKGNRVYMYLKTLTKS